jgi:hypothetical protein
LSAAIPPVSVHILTLTHEPGGFAAAHEPGGFAAAARCDPFRVVAVVVIRWCSSRSAPQPPANGFYPCRDEVARCRPWARCRTSAPIAINFARCP